MSHYRAHTFDLQELNIVVQKACLVVYNDNMRKQLLISFIILIFIFTMTVVSVLYAKGYRFGLDNGRPGVLGTGLLVVTSNPDGAQVLVNDHLTTATNNTINLSPGTYDVKIVKDGYFRWEKKITIEKEVVSKAEATLFPTAPKLENITESGVGNPAIDPSYTKIAYTVASQSARKNGIYVLDMANRSLLTLQSASTQIADDTVGLFSTSELAWSPDGKQIIATISSGPITKTIYLLNATSFNSAPQDITETLATVEADWQKQTAEKDKAMIAPFPAKLRSLISTNFNVISWSPDETKIFYVASVSATIPAIITPPVIGTDSTTQARTIQKDAVYVYDSKEDKNYLLFPATKQLGTAYMVNWFPDSKHLVVVHDRKIDIEEYDGGNITTVYAGPFTDAFVYPWPTATKIVILTNLNNPDIIPNLYTVDLK